MKLRTKLLIDFTVLFFVLFNIFGFILIKAIFYTSLDNAVESSFSEYNIIYSNLQSGESMSRQFYSVQDIITLKNNTYLRNSDSELLDLVVQNEEKEEVYTSAEGITIPDELYEDVKGEQSAYMMTEDASGHRLLINKQIQFDDDSYYLIYSGCMESLYTERGQYLIMLFLFNLIGGAICVAVIYIFTRTITRPLQMLVKNTEELIRRNYDIELKDSGDIAEIHMLTDSFNAMSREVSYQMNVLEEANKEKQRFIDSLTHEIRTPLTSIIGYSSLCREKKELPDSAVQQSFDNIYKNGKRIEKLTENLIRLITLDKTQVNLKKVTLKKILGEIKTNYQVRMENEGIRMILPEQDMEVAGDEDLLNMLFSNFIDNAIKAVSGREKREINIDMKENEVLIRDSGKGMEKEDMEKIFEPFYMADKSRKRTFEGFGLGLAICARIMEILNIQFEIESQPEQGTTIRLKFRRVIL